jgi:hypothetical protein
MSPDNQALWETILHRIEQEDHVRALKLARELNANLQKNPEPVPFNYEVILTGLLHKNTRDILAGDTLEEPPATPATPAAGG